jgi:mannosyl-3-phosphoglycerate phosphatase family protein
MAERRRVLFTDLDGTFLDHHTYSPGPALTALRRLQQAGVTVVFSSAKTLAEQQHLAEELGLPPLLIVENGAAVALPEDFPAPAEGVEKVTVFGLDYPLVRRGLAEAAAEVGAQVRGYGDMTTEEVAAETGLDLEAARRAKQRRWSETFLLLKGDPVQLREALERRGLQLVRGARFLTAMGQHDKGVAVRHVLQLMRLGGLQPVSFGVGDADNDLPLLEAVDHPMLVRAHDGSWADGDLPGLVRLEGVGPEGWVEAAGRVLAG